MSTMLKDSFEVYHVDFKKAWKWISKAKFVFLAVLALVGPARATVYYVDSGSGSDSNSGTSTGSAWAHIPGAVGFSGSGWATLRSGDKVVVKGGTVHNYQLQFLGAQYSGSAAYDSIVVQSGDLFSPQWGTTSAIIDGQNTRTWGVAFGEGGSTPLLGITVDGFEIRNFAAGAAGSPWDGVTGSACVEWGGNNQVSYCTMRRCWLHDAARSVDNTGHGIEFASGDHFIITQNHIGPNIGTKGIEPYTASMGVISNNFISGTGDHCIALSLSTKVDVCNNVIYNIGPQVHEPQYGISVPGSVCCDIWNNLIYTTTNVPNAAGMDWGMGIGCYTFNISNRIVFNTVAYFGDYQSGGVSVMVRVGDSSTTPMSTYSNVFTLFENNICYKGFNAFGNIQYDVWQNCVTNETLAYNDFYATSTTESILYLYNGSTYVLSTVAGFSPGPGHTFVNNVELDPAFTGGPLPSGLDPNFHPNSNHFMPTSAVNTLVSATQNALQGDSIHGFDSSPGKFGTDILGAKRSGYSMGAYEVGGSVSSPPPTAPPAPTGLHVVSSTP